MAMAEKDDKTGSPDATAGGGFLKGLTDLIEKLNELAETGQELRQTSEFSSPDQKLKGVYGFNVRFGAGGKPVGVRPFGNVKFDQKSQKPVVQEVHEPLVDVLDESDRILVIAEMPGVSVNDISLQIHGDVMTIEAHRGGKKYRKEVVLPKPADKDKTSISANNGIVQIECRLE
jgi:HSP20 family protein